MVNNSRIHFVMTGGTIDSFYDSTKDTVVPNKKSSVPDYINGLKLYDNFQFTQVCMKDSRSITNADRAKIRSTIEKSPCKLTIITHGTYTMTDTAKILKTKLKNKDKTIILTGSMIPLIGFSPSDAPFNLGYSIAKIKDLSPGIYVCMNGKIFTPEEVVKYLSEGRFRSIFEK